MGEIVIAKMPIPQASAQQFCGLVTYAGEVAANLFFNGGKGITLQVGHYVQNPNTHQEDWVSGIDVGRNELVLRAVCDVDPSGGAPADVNPFLVPFWNPHNANGGAMSIQEVLGDKVGLLEPYVPATDCLAVMLASTSRMFMLAKCAGSIFAVCVNKGVFMVPLQLLRGTKYASKSTSMEKVVEMREVDEVKRNEKGVPIYHTVLDAAGKPEREPVLHPKTKRPMLTPEGEIRTQVKLVPETQKVMCPFEKLVQKTQEVEVTPLYLQTELREGLTSKMFDGISDAACSFDPTWMLGDVMAGKCKNLPPYRPGGNP